MFEVVGAGAVSRRPRMSCSLKNYTSGEIGLKFPGINALFTPHYGELAIRAFDGVDYYSFDFVRIYRDDQLVNLLTEKVLGIPML